MQRAGGPRWHAGGDARPAQSGNFASYRTEWLRGSLLAASLEGMSIIYRPARLAASWAETPSMQGIRLEVAPEVVQSHTRVGQFLKVRLPGETEGAYYAVASPPGDSQIELLVKKGEGLPDELVALPVGDQLETSEAMGMGFPLAENRGRDLLLFATGSGIAPIRALLRAIEDERPAYGKVELFFGVRTPEECPYCQELERFQAGDMKVHRVISRQPPATGRHIRYVQERFRSELPAIRNETAAFLCGREGMVEEVTAALIEAGLPPEHIHLNT